MANLILPKITPVTPKELYLQLINGSYETIRQNAAGMEYIPAQFGGIFGQDIILKQGLTMEITPFSVK